jgi:DNA mismatch endonuclease (patch repair protein)
MPGEQFIRDGRSPIPAKYTTSLVMRANKAGNTRPEIALRQALWASGIRGYRLHVKALPGSPDLVFTSKRVAIFIHGCYWHRCPNCKPHFPKQHGEFWAKKFAANKERDERKREELVGMGWRVMTIWECQVKKELIEQIVLILNVVRYGEATDSH